MTMFATPAAFRARAISIVPRSTPPIWRDGRICRIFMAASIAYRAEGRRARPAEGSFVLRLRREIGILASSISKHRLSLKEFR